MRHALFAMTHHRTGDAKHAAAALQTAHELLAQNPAPRAADWLDWLHAEILIRQADALLKDKPL
jgi:hypothetical protein